MGINCGDECMYYFCKGGDFCSRSKTDISCFPCSEICPDSSCNFCPKQCENRTRFRKCYDVCFENCLNGECEYKHGHMNLTCIGCKTGLTGQRCHEFCPQICNECYQFNLTCKSCKGNSQPPSCIDITKVTTAIFTSTTASYHNCSAKCNSCNNSTRVCNKCSDGYYGSQCENVCTHCNISLCERDAKCIEFISNCIECATAWREFKTTTAMPNCTDQYCLETPDAEQIPVSLICGLLAVVILTVGIIVAWKKLSMRYRLRCEDLAVLYGYRNQSSGSLAANQLYTYIDDNILDPSYNRLNDSRTRPEPCLLSNHYESVGNKDVYQDVEEASTFSSTSETIFGNLFDLNDDGDECNLAQRQSYHDKEYVALDEYELHSLSYLTPSMSATGTASDTL